MSPLSSRNACPSNGLPGGQHRWPSQVVFVRSSDGQKELSMTLQHPPSTAISCIKSAGLAGVSSELGLEDELLVCT